MRQAFRILLALFALFLLSAHAQEAVVEEEAPAPMSRRLFSFWSLLFLANPKCPPIGPPHDHCVNAHSDGSGGSGGSGYSGDSSGGNGYSGDSSSGGGNVYSGDSALDSQTNNAGSNGLLNPSSMSFWYLMAAIAAAVFAAGAILVGQRKKPKTDHQLAGSVARRMGLFSNFADSALCANRTSPRVVEMTMSKDDYAMA